MLKKKITILALETSADETGAAVLLGDLHTRKFSLRSNVIYSQIAKHRVTGGIVPEVAAREHLPKVVPAIKTALNRARLTLPDIDAVAVTAGPGLATSLMIGVDTAKTLSYALRKPLVAINHLEGHLLSALPKNSKFEIRNSKLFPAICLVVSGGHTQLILMEKIGQYELIGETRDDAAGECLDKVARILELGYPGGPAIAVCAAKAKLGGRRVSDQLPRPMMYTKNYDFSFSGLKTAVLYKVKKGKYDKIEMCREVQQAVIDVLIHKTVKAAKDFRAKSIILGGGVAANEELREQFKLAISNQQSAIKFFVPPQNLCTDNAVMVAATAYFHRKNIRKNIKAEANLRISEIK